MNGFVRYLQRMMASFNFTRKKLQIKGLWLITLTTAKGTVQVHNIRVLFTIGLISDILCLEGDHQIIELNHTLFGVLQYIK